MCFVQYILDIDECIENNHRCVFPELCKNNVGSYTCSSYSGYSGDGRSCTGKVLLENF